MSIALITGGSSGIGFETANALREKGVTVYEMSRRESHQDGVIHLSGDVTNKKDIEAAVNTVISKEGRIDILINNAGFGISGAAEFTPIEAAQKQFNVNFFGLCSMCSSVIPHMRKNGGGRIVNISSVAAVAPISFQAFTPLQKPVSTHTRLPSATRSKILEFRLLRLCPETSKPASLTFVRVNISEMTSTAVKYTVQLRKWSVTSKTECRLSRQVGILQGLP